MLDLSNKICLELTFKPLNIVRLSYCRGTALDYLAPLRSDLKLNIMQSLLKGEKKISELKSDIDSTETSILHVLKEFENLGLTAKSSGVYKLTMLGVMEAQICKEYASATNVVETFREFWLTHDIGGLPEGFVTKIGALKSSVLIKSTSMNLRGVHENFMKMLLSSNTIKGISPIFHPDYISTFKNVLEHGCNIDLVVTNEVLAKTMADAEVESLQKFVEAGKIRIFVNDDLRFALTVTDAGLSLGLFTLAGDYDYSSDLVCSSPEGIEWGNQLFARTLEKSARLL